MFFGNYSFNKGDNSKIKYTGLSDVNLTKFVAIFLAIYKTRSLAKASKILSKTKSSLSKSLKQLEFILNKKLFNRNGRNGLSATCFGERFFFIQNNLKL